MSWRKTGEARWEGRDFIHAPFFETRQVQSYAVGMVGLGAVLAIACAVAGIPGVLIVLLVLHLGLPIWIGQFAQYMLIAIAAYYIFRLTAEKFAFGLLPVQRFYSRGWKLLGTDGKLALQAGQFDGLINADEVSGRSPSSWAVALDSIERVEVGLTRDWIPARQYHGAPSKQRGYDHVPAHEYQTYLHLSDGTRRVILTANADREGCAALAHSVRAWIDGERRNATRQHVAAGGEGFAV